MLEKINSPEDIKKLNIEEKKQLAEEISNKSSIRKWRTSGIKLRSGRINTSTTQYI